jgi:flagellar basal-body rod modification protein FlgD
MTTPATPAATATAPLVPASTPAASAATPPATTGAAKKSTAEVTPENPGATLGKNGFLQLMIAQLQAQDPLQPTESSAYVGELAQFTELEQVTNLAQTSSQSAEAQNVAQAVQLIGHKVSYKVPTTGAAAEGVVQNVQISSTGATLTIEGIGGIEPASITEVS